MPNPQGSFVWYELMSPDPDGSKRFYDPVAGWTIDTTSAVPGGTVDYRMIKRADGGNAGGILHLSDEMKAHGARAGWLGYLNADDVDAKVAEVTAHGGSVLMPPWDAPGVGRMALIADPDGNPMYLMKPIPPAGQPDASSDVFAVNEPGKMAWNELSTPNPDTVRAFYRDLFGWQSDDFMPMGEFGEYRFFDHGGLRIGAISKVMPGTEPGWRYYINVPSIGRAVETVQANGGTVTMGPHEVPGPMHIIMGKDPQGATFALVAASA